MPTPGRPKSHAPSKSKQSTRAKRRKQPKPPPRLSKPRRTPSKTEAAARTRETKRPRHPSAEETTGMSAGADITTRTKATVGRWASPNNPIPPDKISITAVLDELRGGAYAQLLAAINLEFRGERNFPITIADWNNPRLKTVGEVRDKVLRRIEG